MLDEIKKSMSAPADRMSKRLAENSIKTVNAIERGQVQAALAQAELKEKRADIEDWIDKKIDDITDQVDDLRDEQRRHHEELRLRYEKKIEEIRKKRPIGTGRLLAAFSDLRHKDFDDILREIKERHN